jgi:hypothetical protein
MQFRREYIAGVVDYFIVGDDFNTLHAFGMALKELDFNIREEFSIAVDEI